MKPQTALFSLLTTGVFIVVGILGHHYGARAHMTRKLGQQPHDSANCFNCHFVSTKNLAWAKPRAHHDSPSGLVVSPDGERLYIALDDRDELAEVNVNSRLVLRRVRVPGTPFGLALDCFGSNLFVTCRNEDRLAVLDRHTLKQIDSAPVGAGPVSVAFCTTPAGNRLIVANSISDDISILSTSPLREISRPAAGREPFGVAATPDGSRAFVANRLVGLASVRSMPASELTVVDPASARVISRQFLESAHLSESVSAVPGSPWVLTPLVKVRNFVPITQVANGWVMSSGMAIWNKEDGVLTQIPLDEANDYFSDPSGIVVESGGHRAYIASGGADVVTVVDLDRLSAWLAKTTPCEKNEAIYDLSLSATYVTARIPTQRNPKHLALSPDGSKLFIAERLQDSVQVVDTKQLRTLGRIVLGDAGMDDPIRRGERVFSSSAYTFQRQFSCRSCHPDGHVDGLSYDFDGDGIGDNLLDNRSLQGVAGSEPFKWNGMNPSLEVQCGPRFAKVLMRTEPFPPRQLHDLTTYIKSLPPGRSARGANPRLTPTEERGRAIFFATRTPNGKEIPIKRRCVTCHAPPLYTVRLRFDVGTRGTNDSSGLFDTPHLLGIADTAPYLHDGRAQSLEEIWTLYNPNDEHGVSSYMNKIQLNDLVEFLKTL